MEGEWVNAGKKVFVKHNPVMVMVMANNGHVQADTYVSMSS